MLPLRLPSLLAPIALAAMALAMYGTTSSERRAAMRGQDHNDALTLTLTGTVERESALRGYLLSGRSTFLDGYARAEADVEAAERAIRAIAVGDRSVADLVRRKESLDAEWRRYAEAAIAARRADPAYRTSESDVLLRKNAMDQLRAVDASLAEAFRDRRNDDLRTAETRSIILIVLLTAVIGAFVAVVARREARKRRDQYDAEIGYRATQREFTDVIQVVRSEPEAHRLLKRHLELSIPGATATVLNRNNSDNRLEAMTGVAPGSVLEGRMGDAEPASCMAAHLGRRHRDEPGEEHLLQCGLCGASGRSACEPLLVGGQVIGSVLLEHTHDLGEDGERRLGESVSQAAPVLGNLRNLAIAERRAATDALTGLPNRRAAQDTLKRMAAQASRSVRPLTAIAIDLDRFKDINDRFGHEMGDRVLAHVSALLTSSVRSSDFVSRLGGEEFLVLAPDTGLDGAGVLAENLRAALERESVPGLDRDVTASFGVAVLPDHASTDERLLRLADRALYAAKAAGRNRVETIDPVAVATA